MSDEDANRPGVHRRLVWVVLAVAGVALFVRVACYQSTLLESCKACLRDAPGRCATSTSDTEIARQPGFNAREDARKEFGCEAKGYAPCTLHPPEDFVFTCEQKLVDLPPDWQAPLFGHLSPR